MRPALGFEIETPEGCSRLVKLSDVSIQARWNIREGMQLLASAAHSLQDVDARPRMELGLEWWF